jgi:hypothetical protein
MRDERPDSRTDLLTKTAQNPLVFGVRDGVLGFVGHGMEIRDTKSPRHPEARCTLGPAASLTV